MMTDDVVERVAIAMAERAGSFWGDCSNDPYAPPLICRLFWIQEAEAAIEALRQPTSEMIDAGYGVGYSPDPLPCDEVWQAMIDAALASHGTKDLT